MPGAQPVTLSAFSVHNTVTYNLTFSTEFVIPADKPLICSGLASPYGTVTVPEEDVARGRAGSGICDTDRRSEASLAEVLTPVSLSEGPSAGTTPLMTVS